MRIVQRNNDAVLVDAALAPGTMVVTQGVQLLRAGRALPLRGRRAAAGRPRAATGRRPLGRQPRVRT